MTKLVVIVLAVACVSMTSCANTARGMRTDAGQTAGAVQDSTGGVLKAGAKGNKAAQ